MINRTMATFKKARAKATKRAIATMVPTIVKTIESSKADEYQAKKVSIMSLGGGGDESRSNDENTATRNPENTMIARLENPATTILIKKAD